MIIPAKELYRRIDGSLRAPREEILPKMKWKDYSCVLYFGDRSLVESESAFCAETLLQRPPAIALNLFRRGVSAKKAGEVAMPSELGMYRAPLEFRLEN